MTIRRWLTMAFAAAMLAGASACKNTSDDSYKATPTGAGATEPGSSTTGERTGNGTSANAPEGRRATPLPRARGLDAGVRDTASSGSIGSNPSSGGVNGTESGQTTSGVSSGANSDNAPATGTTPGGSGQTPSNASGTDNSTSPAPGK